MTKTSACSTRLVAQFITWQEASPSDLGRWLTLMLGGFNMSNVPHHIQALTSDLHVMFGCNWAANKSGNNAYYLKEARDRGAKVIVIDPWYNQTAQVVTDQWIPILPGTDGGAVTFTTNPL